MGRKPNTHFCGRCEGSFSSKQALKTHLQDHEDVPPAIHECPVCQWVFDDSLALENHQIQNKHWGSAPSVKCNRCTSSFRNPHEYERHRQHGQPCCDANHSEDWKKSPRRGYVDPDKPNPGSKQVRMLEYDDGSTGTPSDMDGDQEYCHYCKKTFASQFAHDRHLLGCTALNTKLTLETPPESPKFSYPDQDAPPLTSLNGQNHTVTIQVPSLHVPNPQSLDDASNSLMSEIMTLKTRAPVPRQQLPMVSPVPSPNQQNRRPSIHIKQTPQTGPPPTSIKKHLLAHAVQPTGTGSIICDIKGCQRSYNSQQGLKMHQIDAHGVGGKGLDLYGKDSWMLGQRAREQLKAEGLLRSTTNAYRGGKNNRGGSRVGRAISTPAAARAMPLTPSPYHQTARNANVNIPQPPLPTSQNICGVLEMEQARFICGKTLRLLLQTDIFIHHDGKMSLSGINWTRIGIDRQPDVVGMFNKMCHLPRKLQALEYVPAPKTFLQEYNAQYPVTDFESAPTRNPAKPGVDIIAMACSKITLDNGCHEVVKIAAIDVLTCRVLMSHLVCTDPTVQVTNWYPAVTGLTSFEDLEAARQAGYKVLKGWTAARSALFKFIDKDTIIVGHNLRSELDALRIVHGRAVDIVKVVEKAAGGPLSTVQVSLDSWCRDVANVASLKTDPVFGRDCIMNAFAAREIGLWYLKNQEQFEKAAKQRTKEYQLVMNA